MEMIDDAFSRLPLGLAALAYYLRTRGHSVIVRYRGVWLIAIISRVGEIWVEPINDKWCVQCTWQPQWHDLWIDPADPDAIDTIEAVIAKAIKCQPSPSP